MKTIRRRACSIHRSRSALILLVGMVYCLSVLAQNESGKTVYMRVVGPQGVVTAGDAQGPAALAQFVRVTSYEVTRETGRVPANSPNVPTKIAITRQPDKNSPYLQQANKQRTVLPEVDFRVCESKACTAYNAVTIKDATVAMWNATMGKAGEELMEDIVFQSRTSTQTKVSAPVAIDNQPPPPGK